ncbi:tRNA pseudouridine synthase, putative [Babesia caballi]|uniref:peptidylprolyl isomerase n=1 Tax=Babesia caballi TaxID=5871 RepID=A0AAV4LR10_BABCB|nr:tRNA pseudouridine synthase, putative [Babesia caballi]
MSRCKRRFGGSRTARSADQPSKRNRSEPSFTENATVASDAGSGDEASGPRVHVPKTKYAIAFGYLGTAYHGFQIQSTPDEAQVDTVEGRMLEALFAAGAIHESHRNVMAKLQLSKASRTDKGVHAACTYIGGRFELSHLSSGEPDVSREVALTAKLNDILPQDIRCFQILRVTRGFCARAMCSKRKYEYVLPTWLLRRRYVLDSAFKQERFAQLSDQMASHLETSDHVSCVRYGRSDGYDGTTEEREADLNPQQLLESILGSYCGSHDFKNFTPRQKGMEHTTQRFIHEVKVERRELPDGDAVSVVITGQSFLYNQIRKMLSLAYEVYLGTAPTHAIKFALSRRHAVQTAIAPAEGLFLHHDRQEPLLPGEFGLLRRRGCAYRRRRRRGTAPGRRPRPGSQLQRLAPSIYIMTAGAKEAPEKGDKPLGGPPYLTDFMTNPANPVVFIDVQVGAHPLGTSTVLRQHDAPGRLKIELFADKVPRTAENFRQLCTGEFKHNAVPAGYKGTIFHKIVAECMVQGGDFVKGDGTGSLSIYGHSFADENFALKHTRCGVLSMANSGPNSNGCMFNIVTRPCDWMDGRNVVFGCLVDDESILTLRKMESITVGENFRPKLPPPNFPPLPHLELTVEPPLGHAVELVPLLDRRGDALLDVLHRALLEGVGAAPRPRLPAEVLVGGEAAAVGVQPRPGSGPPCDCPLLLRHLAHYLLLEGVEIHVNTPPELRPVARSVVRPNRRRPLPRRTTAPKGHRGGSHRRRRGLSKVERILRVHPTPLLIARSLTGAPTGRLVKIQQIVSPAPYRSLQPNQRRHAVSIRLLPHPADVLAHVYQVQRWRSSCLLRLPRTQLRVQLRRVPLRHRRRVVVRLLRQSALLEVRLGPRVPAVRHADELLPRELVHVRGPDEGDVRPELAVAARAVQAQVHGEGEGYPGRIARVAVDAHCVFGLGAQLLEDPVPRLVRDESAGVDLEAPDAKVLHAGGVGPPLRGEGQARRLHRGRAARVGARRVALEGRPPFRQHVQQHSEAPDVAGARQRLLAQLGRLERAELRRVGRPAPGRAHVVEVGYLGDDLAVRQPVDRHRVHVQPRHHQAPLVEVGHRRQQVPHDALEHRLREGLGVAAVVELLEVHGVVKVHQNVKQPRVLQNLHHADEVLVAALAQLLVQLRRAVVPRYQLHAEHAARLLLDAVVHLVGDPRFPDADQPVVDGVHVAHVAPPDRRRGRERIRNASNGRQRLVLGVIRDRARPEARVLLGRVDGAHDLLLRGHSPLVRIPRGRRVADDLHHRARVLDAALGHLLSTLGRGLVARLLLVHRRQQLGPPLHPQTLDQLDPERHLLLPRALVAQGRRGRPLRRPAPAPPAGGARDRLHVPAQALAADVAALLGLHRALQIPQVQHALKHAVQVVHHEPRPRPRPRDLRAPAVVAVPRRGVLVGGCLCDVPNVKRAVPQQTPTPPAAGTQRRRRLGHRGLQGVAPDRARGRVPIRRPRFVQAVADDGGGVLGRGSLRPDAL